MKPLFLVLMLVLSFGWLHSQQKSLKSEITAVTVYADRAEVIRSASVQLMEGDYEFVFPGLPADLDDQSLRVSGEGSARAKISDIRLETEFLDTVPKNALKNLQDQLAQLLDEERVVTDRISLLNKEKEFLDLIKVSATSSGKGDKETGRPTVDEWTRLFSFYDQNYEKIHQELRAQDKKKSEIAKKKAQLQEQISQLSGYTQMKRKKAVISLNVTRAGQMKFNMAYVIAGARWFPYYDLRVSSEDQSVELVYYAVISQNTGEDWNNVQLAISTARPYLAGSVPVLSSWYLNVYQPVYDYAARDKKKFAKGGLPIQSSSPKMAMSEEKSAEEDLTGLMDYETTSVEQRSTSVVFNVKKLSTIPSDKKEHKVTVAIEKLTSVFEYSTVPKLAPYAYLTAWIENTTDFPFLAGNTNIFFGNSFVGTASIPTVIPTEKFQASLGVDEGIKIKREPIRDFRSETGIFSKNIKKTYEYKITVESYRKSEDTIKIRDHFPIPRDERIKVELLQPDFNKKDQAILNLPNGVVEKLPGQILEWRLRVKPKEKYELRLKYTVEYPRDLKIEGLE